MLPVVIAHVWFVPAATEAMEVATITGAITVDVFPLPTCPAKLYPQHHRFWLVSTAHVCQPPTATWVTLTVPGNDTFCGPVYVAVSRDADPVLLSPQHHSDWSVRIAHVCAV